MAPQISVNILFGSMKIFKICHFYIYLNLNRKILATFNKNDHMNVVIRVISVILLYYINDIHVRLLYNYFIYKNINILT